MNRRTLYGTIVTPEQEDQERVLKTGIRTCVNTLEKTEQDGVIIVSLLGSDSGPVDTAAYSYHRGVDLRGIQGHRDQ